MNRERWLEEQMDSEDFDMSLFDEYTKELNAIQAERNERKLKRDAILEEMRQEERDQAALDRILALTDEEVEKMYVKFYTEHFANAMTYEQWLAKSMKYYQITEKFTVIAKARSANTEELIEHVNLAHAKHTILKRIKHKFYDHFVRGRDFRYDIDEQV